MYLYKQHDNKCRRDATPQRVMRRAFCFVGTCRDALHDVCDTFYSPARRAVCCCACCVRFLYNNKLTSSIPNGISELANLQDL